jgi:hypothetical protein
MAPLDFLPLPGSDQYFPALSHKLILADMLALEANLRTSPSTVKHYYTLHATPDCLGTMATNADLPKLTAEPALEPGTMTSQNLLGSQQASNNAATKNDHVGASNVANFPAPTPHLKRDKNGKFKRLASPSGTKSRSSPRRDPLHHTSEVAPDDISTLNPNDLSKRVNELRERVKDALDPSSRLEFSSKVATLTKYGTPSKPGVKYAVARLLDFVRTHAEIVPLYNAWAEANNTKRGPDRPQIPIFFGERAVASAIVGDMRRGRTADEAGMTRGTVLSPERAVKDGPTDSTNMPISSTPLIATHPNGAFGHIGSGSSRNAGDTTTSGEQTEDVRPFVETQTVSAPHLSSTMPANRLVGNVGTNMGNAFNGTIGNALVATTNRAHVGAVENMSSGNIGQVPHATIKRTSNRAIENNVGGKTIGKSHSEVGKPAFKKAAGAASRGPSRKAAGTASKGSPNETSKETTRTVPSGPFEDIFIQIIEIVSIEPKPVGYLVHSENGSIPRETIEKSSSTIRQNVSTGTIEGASFHILNESTHQGTTKSALNGTIASASAENIANPNKEKSRHPYLIWLELHRQSDHATAPTYAECKAIASSLGKSPGTTYHQITEHEAAATGILTKDWYGRNKWSLLAGGQPGYVNEEEREQMRMWYKSLRDVDTQKD